MTDKEIITNYLSLLKSNVEVYVHGTIESSNKNMIDLLKHGLDQTLLSKERTYNEMVNKNWYQVNNVSNEEIKEVFTKINETF